MGLETLLLVGVLVVTAMLVTSDPARSVTPVRAGRRRPSPSARTSVTSRRCPTARAGCELTLDVTDAAGAPTEPKRGRRLIHADVGPDRAAADHAARRPGVGQAQGQVSVPLTGNWRLAVTVRTSAIDEATGYVDVPVG